MSQHLPSELRKKLRHAVNENEVKVADLERWSRVDRDKISKFLETGSVREDDCTALEMVFGLFTKGELIPQHKSPSVMQLMARQRGFNNGGHRPRNERERPLPTVPGYVHCPDPASPMFDLAKERVLCAIKLESMTRSEHDEIGASQNNIQMIRHGRVPLFTVPTILKVLGGPKQEANHGSDSGQVGSGAENHAGKVGGEQGFPRPHQ